MKFFDIITYGHPTLRKRADDFHADEIDPDFIDRLVETMYKKDGVGLAAPQVDVSKQVLAATDLKDEYILVNPKIIAHSETVSVDVEGCLSIPGFEARVPRYDKIVVRALDPEGTEREINARGLLARILQHEIDHLNGILYIDRAQASSLVRVLQNTSDDSLSHRPVEIKDLQHYFKEQYHPTDQTTFQRVNPL